MLSGVLLHVIAAAGGVDLAVDMGSGLQGFVEIASASK